MQEFRRRKLLHMGSAEQVLEFREHLLSRSRILAERGALPHLIQRASEPFFKRAGSIAAINQPEVTHSGIESGLIALSLAKTRADSNPPPAS